MKRMFVMVCLALTVLAAWAADEPKSITLTQEERQLVQRNNDFAFNLIRKARKDGENLLLSPLSITCALGMVNNGAAPGSQTRKEIDKVLGAGEGGADLLNAFCYKMLTESGTLDDMTKVTMANNIFMNTFRECHLRNSFAETVNQYYAAHPEALDFTDPASLDVINKWASDHTEGMIDKVLSQDEFDPMIISYLLNALYFKGSWTSKFDAKNTMPYYFDYGSNDRMCWLMQQQEHFCYAENELYKSIILPYGNKAYQMTVFLPRYGKSVGDVLDYLNGERWQQQQMMYDECDVYLAMPRIETETDMRLDDIMMSLGMPTAFMEGTAFTEFCENADGTPHSVYIDLMKQVAKIKLDEEGTEASAVTVIGMKDGAVQSKDFVANRPFLYVISEQSTGSIFFIGQYMGDTIDNQRKSISLTQEERQLVKNNNQFAYKLMQECRDGDKSLILSPLSITYALGMLNNGAGGQTQQEINQVLGAGDVGKDVLNAFCRKMLDESGKLDKGTKVMLSNAIFLNKDYALKPDFVQTAQQYYDATLDTRDFNDGQTLNVINQWASDHTAGMVPQILTEDSFDPLMVSYLLNAVYFKGGWKEEYQFDADETRDEPFGDGSNTVPMMHHYGQYLYGEDDVCQQLVIPYGNEAYQMSIILPKKDRTIGDILSSIQQISSTYISSAEVDVKLPRFEITTSEKLPDVLSRMGMPSAFDPYQADFHNFCDIDTWIGMMLQSAKIRVDEKGTEAAAVTIIGMYGSALPEGPFEFHADRPFLFLISELSTGTIFFIGQYGGEPLTADMSIGERSKEIRSDKYVYDLYGRRIGNGQLQKGVYIIGGRKAVIR